MGDDELVKRIQQGDKDAAEELIRRWYPRVLRYCGWYAGDRQTAEDLTQETFLRLFRALPDYREEGKFRSFLLLIANRLCINESKRVTPYPLDEQEQPAEGASDALRQVEDRDEIRYLLDGLPPDQRAAVILRFGERLSYQDIARAMGCKLRTAQSRVRYALKTMRERKSHE